MTEPLFSSTYNPSTPEEQSCAMPSAAVAQVWIDFDGTLSRRDVLDDLIRTYSVNESWKLIEEQWQTGLIGSKQCLEQQLALVQISDEELDGYLEGVPLDPGALGLLEFLDAHDVPAAVLSDGIDLFIKRILKRHGITKLAVRSNTITRKSDRMALRCPHHNTKCSSGSAHCKCASAQALGQKKRRSIYIGDGRSDLCAAREADYVFAKNALAKFMTLEGREFTPFATLADVQRVLAESWRKPGGRRSIKLAVTSR